MWCCGSEEKALWPRLLGGTALGTERRGLGLRGPSVARPLYLSRAPGWRTCCFSTFFEPRPPLPHPPPTAGSLGSTEPRGSGALSLSSRLPGGSVDAWLGLRRLYGDESELHFWTVAAHYLHSSSQETSASTPAAQEAAPRDRASNPLDICYDVLCENAYFQVP